MSDKLFSVKVLNPVILGLLSVCVCAHAGDKLIAYKKNNFLFDFSVANKNEAFYERNGDYFSGNPLDRTFYVRTTWDLTTHARFGGKHADDTWKSKITLRERANWGSARGVLTTKETTRVLDVDLDAHYHGFNRLVPWFRKAWIKFNINDAFDVATENQHYFKIGIFPYQVGRGISLGEAYAVAPGPLGFFTDNSIDQYAWGALLRGDVDIKHAITYDLYGSIVLDQSSSLAENAEPVNRNCIGCPRIYRGFGAINYICAGRLFMTIFDNKAGKATIEPYFVYNHDPIGKVEFPSDSTSKLGTVGFAIEYDGPHFELGFESAFNMGHQFVKAWDRNKIVVQRDSNSNLYESYNKVYWRDPGTDDYYWAWVSNDFKSIVDSDNEKGAQFNSKRIDTSDLYNANNRFRNAYTNKYSGFMFVADGAYWMRPEELKVVATVAYASGDDQPNVSTDGLADAEVDGDFGGFIGLQEIYSGKRVRSLFVLGQQRIVRPLSAPTVDASGDEGQQYAASLGGFSDLIYTGVGCAWTPQHTKRKVKLTPHVLYYWQAHPVKAYCLQNLGSVDHGGSSSTNNASRALGLELNALLEVQWLERLKGFIAGALFFPGRHYVDIKGKPTNSDQASEVARAARVGIDCNGYPLVNNKTAFFVDAGFECSF